MHMMWIILFGFIAGVITHIAMPVGKHRRSFLITVTLGISGALATSYLGHIMSWYQIGSFADLIGAFVGALTLLALYHVAMWA